ncbi:PRD domain-containing protein [Aliivibrio fischeri]|uniref:BglG family transcription antiterminator n=1 Tax=Aliivibrio fischeri TaxID=668 RepID=UPI0012D8CE00|nr:PRD domain-containing protein [Aliivibrio fischeri]MUK63951.1 PRD domain-containing protein [Aliivibrio fischeri]MUK70361.1 PRD domain-containing protein [Aliivibrio fischeri]MUK73315.1 PRD domain-containing protein [Aliivibrio fischeri]MUK76716.1 PRD domain-containing protein [Aliivibrio fischeri]MUL22712.1 PRD domain-containing protein [Aliivibrio fischeri]
MIQLPYPRLNVIFEALRYEALPQQELAQRCDISTRTIRTDISALNDILASYGAQIQHQRGKGYHFDIYDETRFLDIEKQTKKMKSSPRNAKDRMVYLMMRLLSQEEECKLDDLANQWFVSRTSLQADMGEIREQLEQYNLELISKAHCGLRLFGEEQAIRACIAHILFQFKPSDHTFIDVCEYFFPEINHPSLKSDLLELINKNHIKLTDEGLHHLVVYCGIALHRLKQNASIHHVDQPNLSEEAQKTATELSQTIESLLGAPLPQAEIDYLSIQIAARRVTGVPEIDTQKPTEQLELTQYLLNYVNTHYNYDLRNDEQLKRDLLCHITTMILRVKYQITIPNPLFDHIKRYYPLAYDMTVAAISHWGKHLIPDGEIGYLVMHIGVGLERNFSLEEQLPPKALLVCDSGTSIVRLLESQLMRSLPQLTIEKVESLRDYEELSKVDADFVISTEKVSQKNKPTITVSPIPTSFQLEQVNKLILMNRSHPYMLDKFFDLRYFSVLDKPMTQGEVLKKFSSHFTEDDITPIEFYDSVIERESITSTILGEGIAIPHSLGLLANETKVYTIISPHGVDWGNGKIAHVIFLFAINKDDYEEAMSLYDLFVTFMNGKAVDTILGCHSYDEFQYVAKECWFNRKKDW